MMDRCAAVKMTINVNVNEYLLMHSLQNSYVISVSIAAAMLY